LRHGKLKAWAYLRLYVSIDPVGPRGVCTGQLVPFHEEPPADDAGGLKQHLKTWKKW